MAMIQCEDCGNSISDRAKACPHCGCPVYAVPEVVTKKVTQKKPTLFIDWRIKSALLCVVLFFASYKLGYSWFPYSVHNEEASFFPIVLAILSGLFFVYSLSFSIWKRIVLGVVIPHSFFIYMTLLSLSGGYLLGCVAGM